MTQLVTKVLVHTGEKEPLEVQITIDGASVRAEPPVTDYGGLRLPDRLTPSPFTNQLTTNLSDANHKALNNLAHWRRGANGSKTFIVNEALAQYLSQYKESQQPKPATGILQ